MHQTRSPPNLNHPNHRSLPSRTRSQNRPNPNHRSHPNPNHRSHPSQNHPNPLNWAQPA